MGSGLGHSLEAQAEALGDSDRQDAGALEKLSQETRGGLKM